MTAEAGWAGGSFIADYAPIRNALRKVAAHPVAIRVYGHVAVIIFYSAVPPLTTLHSAKTHNFFPVNFDPLRGFTYWGYSLMTVYAASYISGMLKKYETYYHREQGAVSSDTVSSDNGEPQVVVEQTTETNGIRSHILYFSHHLLGPPT